MDDKLYRELIDSATYGPPTQGASTSGESLVRLVAASVLTRSGEPYFDSLLRLLSAQFDVRLGLVGVLEPEEPATVETLVSFDRGRRVENFRYELHGTPCETVLSPRSLCIYSHDVAELFPLDTVLGDIGASGYVGMPLLDRDGETIGIMALCTTSPLDDPEGVATMLKAFGRRSSLELEHIVALKRAHRGASVIEAAAHDEEFSLFDFVRRLDYS